MLPLFLKTKSVFSQLTMSRPKNILRRTCITFPHESKRLPNSVHCSLPGQLPKLDRAALAALAPGYHKSERQTVTLTELSALLGLTAGIKQPENKNSQVRRWCATGGNLGSVELFVLARSVQGLSPGLYFYQPREHNLAALNFRTGMATCDALASRILKTENKDLPDALILFTGAYHRVSRKQLPVCLSPCEHGRRSRTGAGPFHGQKHGAMVPHCKCMA